MSGDVAGRMRLVLAGVGGDAHSIGLTVLHQALARAGYQVDYLGAQCELDLLMSRSEYADAVLISNMDGHARYYLEHLADFRASFPDTAPLWYLGGYPTLDGNLDDLSELGFDRIFQGYIPVDEVLRYLSADLRAHPPRGRCFEEIASPAQFASAEALQESDTREDVLIGWPTGVKAGSLEANAERLRRHAWLASLQQEARQSGQMLIHPRTGVSSPEGQQALFAALRKLGADVLSFQVDSLTRNNRYEDINRILKDVSNTHPSASLLNGYPAVNYGVEAMARIADRFPTVPLQVRHSTRDPRLLAEISFAAGVAAFEGGALSYNLPYFRDYPISHAVQRWRYVDRLAGRYHQEFGITIDREFFGVLTACLVPPCIAIALNVFEALLAAECGVKSVTLGYAEQGNRAQDLAAVRALYRLGPQYLARAGFADVAVYVVWHQYMGPFPSARDKALEILSGSAVTAARSGAVRLMLKTYAEGIRIPTLEDNGESLRFVRDRSRAEKNPPALGEQDHLEEELILAEATAILDTALEEAGYDVGRAVGIAVARGWFDVPFSPSRWNAGAALPLRDTRSAVRLADPGRLPLPADVIDFHRAAIGSRIRRDGADIPALLERDISITARGDFDAWPLA